MPIVDMPGDDPLSHRPRWRYLTLRVTSLEHASVRRMARRDGLTMSEVVRRALWGTGAHVVPVSLSPSEVEVLESLALARRTSPEGVLLSLFRREISTLTP